MQQPPEPPYYPPQEPFQPTQPYPQPGQYAPGFVPPPRRTSKRKIGCIIAASIGGGLIFLLTLCIVLASIFPPPKTEPGENPFVVPTFASNATPTPGTTATSSGKEPAQASSTTPTQAANTITPTLAPTPTTAPVPTPTAVPPTPPPIPTPTPRPGPSRAQVDEIARTLYSLQPKVKSYDEKTGTLVLDLFSGYAIVVDQDFVKDNIQKVHTHFWREKLYFSSITVESYHNRKDGPPVKLASGKMTWATASTIDWGALFGVGDLWEKYDEKWMSTNQEDFNGQGL